MKQPYITYALNAKGKLVNVDSVPNGKACGCFCTYCGEPLLAKQGAKRKHHFSHLSGTECEAAYESMLHLLAKEKIQETFYSKDTFIIEFEYSSFCNIENCIFEDWGTNEREHNHRCCEKTMKRFDIKQWYDSCEQEITYDNISRRSDLKFYSKEFPERKPIYIEFCVTHASDEAKLHSGNKIIEILIEKEDDVFSLVENGLVEKSESIGPDWDNRVRKIVSFYGFKTKDHNNETISREEDVTRYHLMESGKIYLSNDTCNCKHIERKDHRALCEVLFSTYYCSCVPYVENPYNIAWQVFEKKYNIRNCNLCINYKTVNPWYESNYKLCRLYKHLPVPIEQFKSKMFDTSIAKKCRYFYPVNQGVNTEDNNRTLNDVSQSSYIVR